MVLDWKMTTPLVDVCGRDDMIRERDEKLDFEIFRMAWMLGVGTDERDCLILTRSENAYSGRGDWA